MISEVDSISLSDPFPEEILKLWDLQFLWVNRILQLCYLLSSLVNAYAWQKAALIVRFNLYFIKLWPFLYVWLLKKHYENKVTLRGKNMPLKYCKPPELLMYIEKGFRFLHAFSKRYLDQRTERLLSIKL